MYEDDPDHAIYTALMKCLYGGGPLCDPVGGTVASIQEIGPALLYDCHGAFYRPSNMALAVVGDVDPAQIADVARELMPPARGERPARDYGPDTGLAPATARAEARMEVAAPLFSAGCKLDMPASGPELQERMLRAGLALRCMFGRSSPFYLKHYADGLLNATFGYNMDRSAGSCLLAFDGETAGDPEAVLAAIRGEIERVRREGLDPDLFERQKRVRIGGRIRGLASFEGLALDLIGGQFCGYDIMDAFALAEAVTVREAEAWVREGLDPDRLAMSVILPKEG